MSVSPMRHVLEFWKPVRASVDLEHLARYASPSSPPVPGIQVVRTESPERRYRVVCAEGDFLLFAAVAPMDGVPDGAEPLAEVRDLDGTPVSWVLWYPAERCAVIPFDPDAAVEAFWYERYMPPSKKTVLSAPVLSAYYAVRPLIPKRLKMLLRKIVARKTTAENHLLAWPTDRSLDLLLRLLLRVLLTASGQERMGFLWFWPEGHPWVAVLTHDVETADGLSRVEHVMGLEAPLGLRSSFNFVPRDYDADEALLGRMGEAGFEVGVHGYTHDGLMFSSRPTFLSRAAAVNEVARRWHASGFRSPATYRNLDWLDRLEFEYDSSVTDTAPFEPQPGGCASLYPYLVGEMVELQMTLAQDHTLFGLLGQTDPRTWLEKLACIRECNGMACILTHPDAAPGYIGLPHNEAHYREVLGVIAGSDAWTPLPRELARWWKARAGADTARADCLAGASVGHAEIDSAGRLVIVPPLPPARR